LLRQYQIPSDRIEQLSHATATSLLQRLDFIKYLCRVKGMYQAGRYAGQYYEIVALFDPDYTESVASVNKFIADRTQPVKVLQWLKRNKPELFESALLPSFEELLALCKRHPNRFHDLARRALEGSPEFLHMQTQHQLHRASVLNKGNRAERKPERSTVAA
jgi:hypothetical protein